MTLRDMLYACLAVSPLVLSLSVAMFFEQRDRSREAAAFDACLQRGTAYAYIKMRLPSGRWHGPICVQVRERPNRLRRAP